MLTSDTSEVSDGTLRYSTSEQCLARPGQLSVEARSITESAIYQNSTTESFIDESISDPEDKDKITSSNLN